MNTINTGWIHFIYTYMDIFVVCYDEYCEILTLSHNERTTHDHYLTLTASLFDWLGSNQRSKRLVCRSVQTEAELVVFMYGLFFSTQMLLMSSFL